MSAAIRERIRALIIQSAPGAGVYPQAVELASAFELTPDDLGTPDELLAAHLNAFLDEQVAVTGMPAHKLQRRKATMFQARAAAFALGDGLLISEIPDLGAITDHGRMVTFATGGGAVWFDRTAAAFVPVGKITEEPVLSVFIDWMRDRVYDLVEEGLAAAPRLLSGLLDSPRHRALALDLLNMLWADGCARNQYGRGALNVELDYAVQVGALTATQRAELETVVLGVLRPLEEKHTPAVLYWTDDVLRDQTKEALVDAIDAWRAAAGICPTRWDEAMEETDALAFDLIQAGIEASPLVRS